jgi:uncharacterized protein (TIGR03435 family)
LRFTPDGFTATNISLKMLLREAYGVENDQIIGLPQWADSEKDDVQAKVSSSDLAQLHELN